MGETILIIGGTGFIGSHLCRRLVAEGHDVHLLVRATSSLHRLGCLIERIKLWRGDLLQPGSMAYCLEESRPTVVYDLTGTPSLRHANCDIDEIKAGIESVLVGRINLLHAAAKTPRPPERVLLAGSIAEYGRAPLPYLESMREAPTDSYGAAVVAATHYSQAMATRMPFDLAVLRFALVYGPDQSQDFLIPSLIEACLRGQPFHLKNDRAARDLIYIDDVLDALLLIQKQTDLGGRIVNLSTGRAEAMRDVAKLIIDATGIRTVLDVDRRPRPGEVDELCASPELAREWLGWRAATPLCEGIARTITWHRSRFAA